MNNLVIILYEPSLNFDNMKILFTILSMSAFMYTASAQEDNQQRNDDQLQQQAPRETQVATERAAKVEAVKSHSNNEIDAEKAAKDKGQSANQTKAQPTGLNPRDNVVRPTDPKKIITE